MSTATKSRSQLQPASGTYRWAMKPDALAENGVLVINQRPYLLSPIRADQKASGKRRVADRPVLGWRLTQASGVTYDLRLDGPMASCECGDWIFNRDRAETVQARSCKHLNALKVALPLAGLPLFGPEPEKVPESKTA